MIYGITSRNTHFNLFKKDIASYLIDAILFPARMRKYSKSFWLACCHLHFIKCNIFSLPIYRLSYKLIDLFIDFTIYIYS